MTSLCISRLYDAHAPSLFRLLLSLTGDEGDTRDLLHDLFVKLARRAATEPITDEQAYLFRAARNLAADLLRRRIRGRRALEEMAQEVTWLPVTDHFPSERQARAAAALLTLPEEQRAVVHLKLWEDLTFSRIAEILGIPANTAASRYRYALTNLRNALQPAANPSHEP